MNVSFALIGSFISSGGTFSLASFISAEPQYSDPVCIMPKLLDTGKCFNSPTQ